MSPYTHTYSMIWIHSLIGEASITSKSTVSTKSKETSIKEVIHPAQAESVECVGNHCLYQNAAQYPPGPRTSDRDIGTSLSLKITQVRVLNLKFKNACIPWNYIQILACVFIFLKLESLAFIRFPEGSMNNAPAQQMPHHQKPRPTEWAVMTEQWHGISWGPLFP